MMATANIWNVFLPVHLLGDLPVFLTGLIDETTSSVYITETRPTPAESERIPIIGEFIASKSQTRTRSRSVYSGQNQNVWVVVSKPSTNIPESQVYHAGKTDLCRCVTVLCDQKDLESSFVFAEKDDCVDTTLTRLLHVYRQTPSAVGHEPKRRNMCDNRHGHCQRIFSSCLKMLIVVFSFVEGFLRVITFKWFWSQICILAPSIMNNVTYKLNRFKRVQLLHDAKHTSRLILLDTCGQQLLDTALGVVLMLTVMCCGHADLIATSLMTWADVTAYYLKDLLHWLMGAPAGLKLNSQLTEYMGHFFLYHVYLWSGYLSVLRPVLGWVIWTAASFGTLGLSTQLCLVQDILSMLTLHIYCFYVYAARLYSLQVFALSSLWRLFRGKKWNVLRLRVDSALYSMDQLCVGTLHLTTLFLLLPTTLLYYCVFAALRLLVLSFHRVLMAVTAVINTVPAATVLMRLLRSKRVAGDVMFTVLHDTKNMDCGSSVTLSMQVIQLPLPKLYGQAQTLMKPEPHLEEQQKYSWGELLRRVVLGNLVYPWIDPTTTSDSKEKES